MGLRAVTAAPEASEGNRSSHSGTGVCDPVRGESTNCTMAMKYVSPSSRT